MNRANTVTFISLMTSLFGEHVRSLHIKIFDRSVRNNGTYWLGVVHLEKNLFFCFTFSLRLPILQKYVRLPEGH